MRSPSGIDGNEQLTAMTGVILIVLFAVLGITIVRIGQLIWLRGIWLMFVGPRDRSTLLLAHKASFIVWLVLMAIHVLAHLPGLGASLQAERLGAERSGASVAGARAGALARWVAIGGAIVGGAVIAIVLIPHFGLWTAPGAFPHHHER